MTGKQISRGPRPLWVIVLAAATIAAIGMGLRQVAGLYMKPMTTELGFDRETFSLSVAIANIIWGLAAPFAGAIADTYGAGRVVLVGGLATAAGFWMMSRATTDFDLMLSGVLMGIGVAGAGLNALVGAVGRAAGPEERTAAIATVGMGSGIGILIALPYTHLLMDRAGWQTSLVVLAATALLILPLAIPVSGRPPARQRAADQSLRAALGEAAQHPSYWLLNASFFVCGFHVVFYATHLPAFLADQGLEPWVGVYALMAVGLGNLAGTWLAGQWGRSHSMRLGLAAIYLGRTFVFLAFLVLPITPLIVIALSAALGLLWLSTMPLTSGLVATFYGPRWMSMLFGVVLVSHQAGAFLGAWLGGLFYDKLGSYDAMWWIAAGLGVLAAALSWPIAERPVARLEEEPA